MAYVKDRAAVEGSIVGDDLVNDQIDKILNAKDIDELDAAMEMAGLSGLNSIPAGTELQINGYHLVTGNRAEFGNRLGVFAVMDVQRLSDGTEMVLDTGVERIIAFLRACEANGWLPVQRVVHKIPTGAGELITLKRLPKRAVQG
jgi:hypothetical protein